MTKSKLVKRVVAKNGYAEKKTATAIDEYKGKPILQIWEVDEKNQNISNFPMMSFGLAKVQVLLKHAEDLKEFAHDNAT